MLDEIALHTARTMTERASSQRTLEHRRRRAKGELLADNVDPLTKKLQLLLRVPYTVLELTTTGQVKNSSLNNCRTVLETLFSVFLKTLFFKPVDIISGKPLGRSFSNLHKIR